MSKALSAARSPAVDLTLVINVANEGRLLHPTLRSLDGALSNVIASGATAEVIVVFDGGSAVMRQYLDQHLSTFFAGVSVRVLEVMHRDLGLSRNSGAAVARGTYIAFSDADNLYTSNWIRDALVRLQSGNGREIAHPSVAVTFEGRDNLWHMVESTAPDFDVRWLAEHNFWDSACVVPREAVQEVPYPASSRSPAFGPEDWVWNIETIDHGWGHIKVPKTAMFYRVKRRGSLMALHDGNSALLAPTPFLSRPRPGVQPEPASPTRREAAGTNTRKLARSVGRAGWRSLRWVGRVNPRVRRFGTQLRPALATLFSPAALLPEDPSTEAVRLHDEYPTWLRDEWRAAHQLEVELFPRASRLRTMQRWAPNPTRYTPLYWNLVSRMSFDGESPEYLFVVPWLIPGGATAVLLNYLRAIIETDADAQIVVLITTPRQQTVPVDPGLASVRFINLPSAFAQLAPLLQERMIATLIVQFAPRVVHLINAHVGYRTLARYSAQLASRSKLFLSLFTIDESEEGELVHPALDGIRDYADALDGIFIDNPALGERLIELLALPPERFFVHFQPLADHGTTKSRSSNPSSARRMRVLWAGRLDRQKRPDLLIEIAERSVALGLSIDYFASGMAVLDGGDDLVDRLAAAGVTLLGPYDDSIASIPQSFDVLLNTSQWEGLPLVLIDAAQQDLTLVAAPVGGVVDFVVPGKTGFLVDRFDDVDDYVRVLGQLAANPRLMRSTRSAARALADTRHNWGMFTASLHNSASYLK